MLNISDVTTDLWFIQTSTLPFEIRLRHKIKLDFKGNVTHRRNNNNDDENDDNDIVFGPGADAYETGIESKRVQVLDIIIHLLVYLYT